MMISVKDANGVGIGYIDSYTQREQGGGRWTGRTVERVMWRAIPFRATVPITYHRLKRDAVAAVRKCMNVPTEKEG
jgi:hypothetical protein